MTVFRGEAIRRCLSHDGGTLVNGMSALIKRLHRAP